MDNSEEITLKRAFWLVVGWGKYLDKERKQLSAVVVASLAPSPVPGHRVAANEYLYKN